MEKLGLLEVLDRDGRANQAYTVTRWPVRVGRALDNDVVLSDEHIAAHHFTLDCAAPPQESDQAAAGQPGAQTHPASIVAVVASGTVNGLQFGRTRYGDDSQVSLTDGSEWQAGTTRLRLRLGDAPLAPERPVEHLTIARVLVPMLGLLAIAVLRVLDAYLISSNDDQMLSELLKAPWEMLIAVGAWTLLWAIITKVFRRQMFFLRHLTIAAWGLTLLYLLNDSLAALSFSMGFPLADLAREDVSWLTVALVVWGHLWILLASRRRTRIAGSVLAVVTVSSLLLLGGLRYATTGHWWQLPYSGIIGPPWMRLVRPESVDQFIEQTHGMEVQLQKRASAAREDDDTTQEEVPSQRSPFGGL